MFYLCQPSTTVVQDEAGEGRGPILEYAHQRTVGEVFLDSVFRDPRNSGSVERSPDHEVYNDCMRAARGIRT